MLKDTFSCLKSSKMNVFQSFESMLWLPVMKCWSSSPSVSVEYSTDHGASWHDFYSPCLPATCPDGQFSTLSSYVSGKDLYGWVLSHPLPPIYIKLFTPWNRSGIFLLKCIYQCTLLQIYICPFIQDRIELIIIFYISGDKMCQWIFQNMCASRIRNLHAQMRLSKSVRGPKQLYWNYSYF